MSFSQEQLSRILPLWDRMLNHRFLLSVRDGTVAEGVFAWWLPQAYLFVEAAIPFIAELIAKGPSRHWQAFTAAIARLEEDLRLFEDQALAVGLDLRGESPAFANHAYIQYLMATGHRASYAESYTVLYAAEKAYHDCWAMVMRGIDPGSKWYPFVKNWAGEAVAEHVAYLERELDALAGNSGLAERVRMNEHFELTVKHVIAFWEMAATGEDWPGLGEPEAED
jgi:thiaminase